MVLGAVVVADDVGSVYVSGLAVGNDIASAAVDIMENVKLP